jgi:Fe2+ transport system protein FeoA
VRLSSLAEGVRAVLSRISEVAEREAPILLSYLGERGLVPEASIEVLEVDEVAKTLQVRVGERSVTLSDDTGSKVWVVVHR